MRITHHNEVQNVGDIVGDVLLLEGFRKPAELGQRSETTSVVEAWWYWCSQPQHTKISRDNRGSCANRISALTVDTDHRLEDEGVESDDHEELRDQAEADLGHAHDLVVGGLGGRLR